MLSWTLWRISRRNLFASTGFDSKVEAIKKVAKTKNSRAIKPLIIASAHHNEAVRNSAAEALDQIDPAWPVREAARSAIPSLIVALTYSNVPGHKAAEETLNKIDPNWVKAEEAISAIAPLLKEYMRGSEMALDMLLRLGVPAKEALEDCLDKLTGSPDRMNRNRADEIVLRIARQFRQKSGERVTAILLSALSNEKSTLHGRAACALGLIRDPRAVEPLLSALNSGSTRRDAIDALGDLGDVRAVRPLISIVERGRAYRDEWSVCEHSVAALNELLRSRGILEKVDIEDLERLSVLKADLEWESYEAGGAFVMGGTTTIADCSSMNRLARQELVRRGKTISSTS